ncbi:hypothetical protein WKW80_03220 [Variovorax humicola]|uniref:Uncharacterized protein n=1 Tax=Variovorax humicola TaxID=1769758 RepID=A0ABU8VVB3_9BURK
MFIGAGWVAHRNYQTVRTNIKAAKTLVGKVGKAAFQLAELLHQIAPEVGQYLPPEFVSLEALIERADHDQNHRNFHMWRGLKRILLGRDRGSVEDDDSRPASAPADHPAVELEFVDPDAHQDTESPAATRGAIRYAWDVSPDVASALAGLSRAASEWAPIESDFVGDGIASRKNAPKAQYLRGFLSLLLANRIELSPAIIEAAVVTATVVLNWPNDPVLASEVRNARAQVAT